VAERIARTSSTTEGLPVAPALGPGLASAHIAPHAADVMAGAHVGRLPVLSDSDGSLVGMLTRSDLVGAHRPRLKAERVAARALARG
jgi:CBS-domain-containing membrane protein